MKFKIDENLPVDIVELLRSAQHDAVTVSDQGLGGENDLNIVNECKSEKRILITLDMDFTDIRTYPPHQFYGFIVLRLQKQDKRHVINVFKKVILLLKQEKVEHQLWIVDEARVRIRD